MVSCRRRCGSPGGRVGPGEGRRREHVRRHRRTAGTEAPRRQSFVWAGAGSQRVMSVDRCGQEVWSVCRERAGPRQNEPPLSRTINEGGPVAKNGLPSLCVLYAGDDVNLELTASGLRQKPIRHGGDSIAARPTSRADAAAVPNDRVSTHRRGRPTRGIPAPRHHCDSARPRDARRQPSAVSLSPRFCRLGGADADGKAEQCRYQNFTHA